MVSSHRARSYLTSEMGLHLDRIVAAVDVVAQEEVARVGRVAADLKQLHQVVVLAMDVATDCKRTQPQRLSQQSAKPVKRTSNRGLDVE